jgi:HK97 family phage major capsid protein
MPTKAQLDTQAEQLRESIHEINASDRTDAEKGEALDAVYKDYESYAAARKSVTRSDEMLKSLGEGAEEQREVETDELAYIPSLAEARGAIARQLLKHPSMKANLERARKDLNPNSDAFEIDLKDSTAGANLVGENLYGASGVAYSTPFGTGAVAPGILPNFLPGIVDLRYYPLRFSTLLSSFTTEQPILSYLTEATSVRNAAQTEEAATYPFSSGTFSRAYEQIGKITNAMVLTDETIADAPMLVSFLQDTLLDGVVRQEDAQLLAGSGMPGVKGLMFRSASFTKPQTITPVTNVKFPANSTPGAGTNNLNIASLTYGRAITGTGATGTAPSAAQVAEGIFDASIDIEYNTQFVASAIVMNPLDWAVIRKGKDANGQYFGGSWFGADYGNSQNPGETLWGKRVVTTASLPQGTILVGYFGPEAIQVARRSGISFQMTNSNSDDFVNGKVTMRADERLGLLVKRPSVFELIQLKTAP